MKEYIVQAIAQETIDSFDAHNAPELIRCKDCKKRPDEHETELNGKLCRYCELHRRWTTDDWFCADGKKKSGDQ